MKSKLMKGLVIVALAGSLTACEMDRQQRHTATGASNRWRSRWFIRW